jgi:hypothetical protein
MSQSPGKQQQWPRRMEQRIESGLRELDAWHLPLPVPGGGGSRAARTGAG